MWGISGKGASRLGVKYVNCRYGSPPFDTPAVRVSRSGPAQRLALVTKIGYIPRYSLSDSQKFLNLYL